MKEAMHYGRLTLGLVVLLWASFASAALTVSNLQLISTQRVGRTVFEYTYKADLVNSGQAVQAATVIVDGALDFGNVAAGATVTSTDTFSFRQNRRVAFDPAALSFAVSVTPVSGDTTPPQLSIDTPADGVSVDVSSITLFGTATDDTAVTGVTVNGAPATVSGTGFSATVALTEGANAITVIAGDAAGNTASATVNVTRLLASPPPQISAISPMMVMKSI